MKLGTYLHTIHTNDSKWITDLNVSGKIIKVFEDNMGVNLHDLRLGNNFLDRKL